MRSHKKEEFVVRRRDKDDVQGSSESLRGTGRIPSEHLLILRESVRAR